MEMFRTRWGYNGFLVCQLFPTVAEDDVPSIWLSAYCFGQRIEYTKKWAGSSSQSFAVMTTNRKTRLRMRPAYSLFSAS